MANRQQLVGWAMAMEVQQRSLVLAMIGGLDDNQCATYALVPEEDRLAELQRAAQAAAQGGGGAGIGAGAAGTDVILTAADKIGSGLNAVAAAADHIAAQLAAATVSARVSKTFAMSSVGSTKANQVISSMDFTIVDGEEVEPIQLPEGFPEVAAFAMHAYSDEKQATPGFITYLKKCLADQGVKFGIGGLKLVDVHNNKDMLQLQTELGTFKGFLDAVVVPHGVLSYSTGMRMALELKYTEQDKQIYNAGHFERNKRKADDLQEQENEDDEQLEDDTMEDDDVAAAANATTTPTSTPVVEPMASKDRAKFELTSRLWCQSVMELLGAYSVAHYPPDLVITEGYKYHVMRLRGKRLICWKNLTPGQAIFHMANSLKQPECSLVELPPPPPDTETTDGGNAALLFMRKYSPLTVIREQAEELMELDDGRSRLVQGIDVVRLLSAQHGRDNTIAALVAPPAEFYSYFS